MVEKTSKENDLDALIKFSADLDRKEDIAGFDILDNDEDDYLDE